MVKKATVTLASRNPIGKMFQNRLFWKAQKVKYLLRQCIDYPQSPKIWPFPLLTWDRLYKDNSSVIKKRQLYKRVTEEIWDWAKSRPIVEFDLFPLPSWFRHYKDNSSVVEKATVTLVSRNPIGKCFKTGYFEKLKK